MNGFAQEGISSIRLPVGKADELDQFTDKRFDIVFTDAVLMGWYVNEKSLDYRHYMAISSRWSTCV